MEIETSPYAAAIPAIDNAYGISDLFHVSISAMIYEDLAKCDVGAMRFAADFLGGG